MCIMLYRGYHGVQTDGHNIIVLTIFTRIRMVMIYSGLLKILLVECLANYA